jgi:hypothetical protein
MLFFFKNKSLNSLKPPDYKGDFSLLAYTSMVLSHTMTAAPSNISRLPFKNHPSGDLSLTMPHVHLSSPLNLSSTLKTWSYDNEDHTELVSPVVSPDYLLSLFFFLNEWWYSFFKINFFFLGNSRGTSLPLNNSDAHISHNLRGVSPSFDPLSFPKNLSDNKNPSLTSPSFDVYEGPKLSLSPSHKLNQSFFFFLFFFYIYIYAYFIL